MNLLEVKECDKGIEASNETFGMDESPDFCKEKRNIFDEALLDRSSVVSD